MALATLAVRLDGMADAVVAACKPKIDNYEDLVAWQFANELADLVDTMVETGGAASNESFRNQILKSSSKPPAQIAEGFLRYLPKESAYYYRIARASLGETKNHLRRGFHRKYWDEAVFKKASQLAESALRTTGGLLAAKLAQVKEQERKQKETKTRVAAPRNPRLDRECRD